MENHKNFVLDLKLVAHQVRQLFYTRFIINFEVPLFKENYKSFLVNLKIKREGMPKLLKIETKVIVKGLMSQRKTLLSSDINIIFVQLPSSPFNKKEREYLKSK